jgi:ketosteroid isomerase-like protein
MTLPCIMLMAASLSAFSQGSRTESDESRMILNLENAWNQAEMSHDAHALDSLLADKFVYTDDDGSYMNRSQWLAHVKRGDDHYQQLSSENLTAYLYGDAAVVTGGYREKVELKGKSVVRHGRFTDTWIKQNAEWKCVASQSTLIR